MTRLVGINHLAVEVDDIDAELAFFESLAGEIELRGRGRGMAFVDLGDQFIALVEERTQGPDRHRHAGLVVDDREATLQAARAAGHPVGSDHEVTDPSGNIWQIVDYRDIQFTKAPQILAGMGLEGLEKSERALNELRRKGLA
jgi:lactoylglutathione lyase